MVQKMEINAGVAHMKTVDNALLVDVRNDFEYEKGHIPGSMNLALSRILQEAEEMLPDKAQPVFVYCQSGARSARSAKLLEVMGYETVTDLGGIADWNGPVEK